MSILIAIDAFGVYGRFDVKMTTNEAGLSLSEAFSRKVVGGGKWVFGIRVVDQGMNMLKTAILARLLGPEEFGLFGIALLALSALTTLSRTGFDSAIIQKHDDVRPYLDTVWVVQLFRGFITAIVLLLLGPYIARFFGEPRAAALVRIVGLSLFVKGCSNVGVVYFQKDLQFQKQFLYQIGGTIVNFVVSTILAVVTRSVWSLVWGLVAGQLVSVVISYFLHEYRPSFKFGRSEAMELFKFGGWVWGSGVLGFIALNGDDVLLGRLLGVNNLGFYQTAYRLSQLPSTEITQIISQVMFPAYSKLQNNVSQLRYAYSNHIGLVSSVVFPLTGGILLLGGDFTRLVLGERWMPLVVPLNLLAIAGLVRSIVFVGAPLFMAVGKPRIDFYMTLIRVAVMAVTVYPLTHFLGMTGTCLSVILGTTSVLPMWVYFSGRILGLSVRAFLRPFFSPVIGALAFLLPGVLFVTVQDLGYLELVGVSLAAIGIYVFSQFLLWRWFQLGAVATWKLVFDRL